MDWSLRWLSQRLLKRRWDVEISDDEDEGPPSKAKRVEGTIVVDEGTEEEIIGSGTRQDPIRFLVWSTGKVIQESDHGRTFEIDGEEGSHEILNENAVQDDHTGVQDDRASSPDKGSYTEEVGERWEGEVTSGSEDGRQSDVEGEDGGDKAQDHARNQTQRDTETPLPWAWRDDSPPQGDSDIDDELSGSEPYHIICLDEEDGEEYTYTQDWSQVKEEEAEESPISDPRQAPELTAGRAGLTAAEVGKHEVLTPLQYKKKLFYGIYGPRLILVLKSKLKDSRPDVLEKNKCWLYSGPIFKRQRTHPACISWRHEGVLYKYTVNMGFIALLVEGLLTDKAKEGIIHHAWHASHLCGNWLCTNPRHIIAEPGSINLNRNNCFHGRAAKCNHVPRCMVHLRVASFPNVVRARVARTMGRKNGSQDNQEEAV